jgi:hypothetical protein
MSTATEHQNQQRFEIKVDGKGIVNYQDENLLLFSRGKSLFKKTSDGIEKIVSLYENILEKWFCSSNLFRRLTRSHIHHVLPVDSNKLIVFASKKIFYININKKSIITEKNISGSRPLCVTTFGDYVYYGEYTSNPERKPIRLFRSKPPYTDWEIVKKFTNIRHIHGVFEDPFTNSLWITTGDQDQESWIHQLSDETFEPSFSIGGSQMYRAVSLVFTEKYIYFGSDAPAEKNYIIRFKRGDSRAEKLTEVGGPVFYGCSLHNQLFFSTVCEPSKVNRTDAVELWHSFNGNEWSKALEIEKDIWNMKFFQYGQLLFPKGPGDKKHIRLSSLATKYDQKILKLQIKPEKI